MAGLVVVPTVVAVAETEPAAADVADVAVTASAGTAAEVADTYGHRVEITDEQTETSTTYANPDGTRTTTLWTGPIRAENSDGDLVPIDLTLQRMADGQVAPVAPVVDTTFTTGGDQPLASVDLEHGRELSLDWPTPLPAPTLDANTAIYRIDATTNLVLTATKLGFNAHIVLSAPPAGSAVFRLPLQLARLFAHEGEDGGIVLDNASGEPVAAAGNFVMWDATRDAGGDPANVHDVASLVDGTGSAPTLVLDPSEGWLNDPATQYPVTIDPDLTNLQQDGDTFVFLNQSASNYRYSDYNLGVGPWQQTAANTAKTYLNWSLAAIPSNAYVTAANVRLQQYYAPTCTARAVNMHPLLDNDSNPNNDNFLVSTFNDDNRPTSDDSASSSTSASGNTGASGCANSKNGTNFTIGATALAREWVSGTRTNAGLALNVPVANKNDVSYEKRFCSMNSFENTATTYCNESDDEPQLDVSYATPPAKPGIASVQASSDGTSAAVTWAAPANNGGAITGYRVRSSTGTVYTFNSTATTQTIAGLSDDEEFYTFQVAAINVAGTGTYSDPSKPYPFVSAQLDDGRMMLAWNPLSPAPASYQVQLGGGTVQTLAGSATNYSYSGLTNGTSYTATVTAVYSGGVHARSVMSALIPATTPSSVTGVTATPVSAGSYTVSWTAPASTGGIPINVYTVSAADGSGYVEVEPPATSVTLTGVTAGQTNFNVVASNDVGSGPATALDPVEEAEVTIEDGLIELSNRITGDLDPADWGTISGFAGTKVDEETATLTVYWKDAIPSWVTAAYATVPSGLNVSFVTTTYSLSDELVAASNVEYVDTSSGQPVRRGFKPLTTPTTPELEIVGVDVSEEGGGIEVLVAPVDDTGEMLASTASASSASSGGTVPELTAAERSQLGGELRAISGITGTTFTVLAAAGDESADLASANYRYAGKPITGGSYIHSPENGALDWCTSGFTAYDTSTFANRLITANHCTDSTNGMFHAEGGSNIGRVKKKAPKADAVSIGLGRKPFYPGVYFGPTMTTNKIRIWGTLSQAQVREQKEKYGTKVCTDGANSGKHCGLRLVNLHALRSIAGENIYVYIARTKDSSGVAVVGGDSGGPVLMRVKPNNPYKQYSAVGIISTYGYKKTSRLCSNASWRSGGHCSDRVGIIPIRKVESQLGVSIWTNILVG